MTKMLSFSIILVSSSVKKGPQLSTFHKAEIKNSEVDPRKTPHKDELFPMRLFSLCFTFLEEGFPPSPVEMHMCDKMCNFILHLR